MLKLPLTAISLLTLACTLGCGESGPEMAQVEGVVTLNGQPLDRLRLEFHPLIDGPHSVANTDGEGRFALKTYDDAMDGAAVAKHKVVIHDHSTRKDFGRRLSAKEKQGLDVSTGEDPRISERYSNISTTPLEIEITGETRDLTIEVDPYSNRGRGGGSRSDRSR